MHGTWDDCVTKYVHSMLGRGLCHAHRADPHPLCHWRVCLQWLAVRLSLLGGLSMSALAVFSMLFRDLADPSLAALAINYCLFLTQYLQYGVQMIVKFEVRSLHLLHAPCCSCVLLLVCVWCGSKSVVSLLHAPCRDK